MPDLFDLPPEVRARVLANLGLTEEEYRVQQAAQDKAAREAAQPPKPASEQLDVPEKFKDTPVGVVGD